MALVTGRFDPTGELYATLTADSRLRIWETATGNLRLEHTPTSHLADAYTCLAWSHAKDVGKKKSKGKGTPAAPQMIALGSRTGRVVLFSLAKGELTAELRGHTETVNDLVFSLDNSHLYSCGSDMKIIEWNADAGQLSSEWKADSFGVTALLLSDDGKRLFSAGRTIKLWDIETKKQLKTFTGHGNSIRRLVSLPSGAHFASVAHEDGALNIWDGAESSVQTTAVAVLLPSHTPTDIAVSRTANGKTYFVAAVCTNGEAQVFTVDASALTSSSANETPAKKSKKSGKKDSAPLAAAKPITARSTITVVSKSNPKSTIALTSAVFDEAHPHSSLLTVRGSALKPTFESVAFVSAEGDFLLSVKLKREPASQLLLQQARGADASAAVTYEIAMVGPGDMKMPDVALGTPKKKGKSMAVDDEPSLADQLNDIEALSLAEGATKRRPGTVPKADSLAKLLVQALHSGDKQLLEDCLANTNENVVRNTVQQLPTPYVMPFLEDLINKFQAKPSRGLQLVPWIKTTVLVHASFLMTIPNINDTLGSLYQLLDSRLSVFPTLLALNGRMDLMLAQVTARSHVDGVDSLMEDAVIYEEEDSDEDIEDGDGDYGYSSDGDAAEDMDAEMHGEESDEDDDNSGESEASEDDE